MITRGGKTSRERAIPYLSQRSFAIRQPFRMAIDYGSNRVRFTSPVPVGLRIRNRMTVAEVSEVPGGWQARWQITIEIEEKEKPACVAEMISQMYEAQ